MRDFTYHNPTKILFGNTALDRWAEELCDSKDRLLLVFGGESIKTSGNYERITGVLQKKGIAWFDAAGNKRATVQAARNGVALCREHQISAVVGIGGGSCMDLAKVIGRCANYDADVTDILQNVKAYPADSGLPVIEIPTNPSSGSENDPWCGVDDEETGEHYGLHDAFPYAAVLHPPLSYSLDAKQTAFGAGTALVQLLCTYLAKVDDADVPTAMLGSMVSKLMKAIPLAMQNPSDASARADIMWIAALVTGGPQSCGKYIEWSLSPIAQLLETIAGLNYQQSMMQVFPHWISAVYDANIEGFAEMARHIFHISGENMDEKALAFEAVKGIYDYWLTIGVAPTLQENGFGQYKIQDFNPLIDAMDTIKGMKQLKQSDVRKIIEKCAGI